MRLQKTKLQRFVTDERGATAIEYALIASGIAAAIITTVTTMGVSIQTMYQNVANLF